MPCPWPSSSATPASQGGWTPVAGAVADPCRRLVHHAGRGTGAWTRPEDRPRTWPRPRLSVSAEDRLARTLLATGFGYAPEVRARQAEVLLRVLPLVRDIRRIGSAALDLVRVAEGSVDAYAETGLNAWDLAAGWLIVEEAGGVVVGAGRRRVRARHGPHRRRRARARRAGARPLRRPDGAAG